MDKPDINKLFHTKCIDSYMSVIVGSAGPDQSTSKSYSTVRKVHPASTALPGNAERQ